MSNVVLSIIVPVYNVARYLRASLDSAVVEISEKHLENAVEIVAVDDGSTDCSSDLLSDYSQRYSFVHVFRKSNGGLSSARNLGLDNARGEWVAFFDSDDAYVDGAIEYLLGAISKTDADAIQYGLVDVDDQSVSYPLRAGSCCCLDLSKQKDAIFLAKNVYVGACNCCYRASALRGLRFKVGLETSEDVVFGLEAMCLIKKIEIHNTVLYKYFQRSGSIVHTVSLKRVRGCVDMAVLASEIAKDYCEYEKCRDVFFRKARIPIAGDAIRMLNELQGADKNAGWDYYFSRLSPVYLTGYVPRTVKPFYWLVFKTRSCVLANVLMYFPYVIIRRTLRLSWLHRFWAFIR